MRLEVLHVPDCPNLPPMLQRLADITDVPVATRLIETDADAARFGMAGSPTLLINGTDPFTVVGDPAGSLSCRLYHDETGRIVPAPSVDQLRAAITTAVGADQTPSPSPAEVLSQWRTRAQPLDPVENAVHQAILRSFAVTGRAPVPRDLEQIAAGSGRTAAELLTALHAVDAIRLSAVGQIAVAYPFSATPTRHRVRIGSPTNGVDVYAMCAIDALGIAAMTGHNTLIESVDVTSGRPITVTTRDGVTNWNPQQAVAFVGADESGGPSADCCCDYLNLFTDQAAAKTWTETHPHVPGQILTPAEAEDLARRLFGHLLTTN
ncbi:alkylmercury lyase family protein [Kribbella sp. CA-294648]|uniref:alkylmercury lyase family protein n=1 Tax=Kribbella sp. CA-294648 TaxID=3239948 RepID=UPI003D928B45